MGRSIAQGIEVNSAGGKPGDIAGTTISPEMPITGKFGGGRVMLINRTQSIVVPATSVRVRLWGGGGGDAGTGGGFCMKVISGLTVGASINATIGTGGTTTVPTGGTTSFGSYCSASGGSGKVNTPAAAIIQAPGRGVGGDVNNVGGRVTTGNTLTGGGGAANVLGDGGNSGQAGTSGGGGDANNGYTGQVGGPGGPGAPGMAPVGNWSLDFVGCGGGLGSTRSTANGEEGVDSFNAGNGGGGGYRRDGSFPGGGAGAGTGVQANGGNGYIILEW